MATATKVPQTRTMTGEELSAEDAWATLRSVGVGRQLKDAFVRLRFADGFSHARALAFQMCLAAFPGLIALVGLAQTADDARWGQALEEMIERIAPVSSRPIVRAALGNAGHGGSLALWLGLAAGLFALTIAMGQVERGANRIYGVERDRPSVAKYSGAFLRALISGVPIAAGLALMVVGKSLGVSLAHVYHWSDHQQTAFDLARWPVGAVLALVSVGVLFRQAPRRRQPAAGWLVFGAAAALVLWLLFTAALAAYVDGSGSFSATYGPLTAVLALLLWANLSAMALFYGIAFAAQLEARRAGVVAPVTRDPGV